jgi:hypothetical protein
MIYTTLAAMVISLKARAQIQESEGFTDAEIQTLISTATGRHNPDYVATTTSCNVPARESFPVVLLSWIDVCYVRASKFSTEATLSQSGFSSDRNTPFYKCLALAEKLMEQYATVCGSLGLETSASGGVPVQTEVTTENADLGAQTPVEMSKEPPTLTAASTPADAVNDDGSIVINWSQQLFDNFSGFHIVYLEGGTASIFQEWNFNSASGVPRLIDTAEVIAVISDPSIHSVKLIDLDPTVGLIHHFIVASKSKSGKWSYSAEITFTQTYNPNAC